jgi:hypothetical protein
MKERRRNNRHYFDKFSFSSTRTSAAVSGFEASSGLLPAAAKRKRKELLIEAHSLPALDIIKIDR